jgi:hypothetical protein
VTITKLHAPLHHLQSLCRLETTRRVSVITITLSREPLDSSNVGYQPPLPEDQVRSTAVVL